MTVVLANAGRAMSQIMQNASREVRRMASRAGRALLGRRQCVEHDAGVRTGGGNRAVGEGEGPAALVPGVLGKAADVDRRAAEAACGEGLCSSAVAVAAAGPADLGERNRVTGAISERGRYRRDYRDRAVAIAGGAVKP